MKNLFSQSMSKKRIVIISASFVVFAAVLGYALYEGTKNTVALTLDGEKKEIKTHAETIQDIFDELDISLRSEDYVHPSLTTKVKNNLQIMWEPAKQVQVTQDNEEKIIWTTAKTVDDLLKEQKIELNEHDQIEPEPKTAIKGEMKIAIKKAFPFKLVVGGEEQEVWSTSTTVADFLTSKGITLNELDRVEPDLNESVNENTVINVIRVEKVTDVVEEPVDFAVVTKKDSNLTKGKEQVVQEGEKGSIQKEFEVILENGKEVSRKLISENQVKDKQDKIVAVGTKVIEKQVSRGTEAPSSPSAPSTPSATSAPSEKKAEPKESSEPESNNSKEFYVTATAYTPNCNGCSGYTATGINIEANPNLKIIAVDPSVIPLGSKVYVEGYGYAIAGDTGSSINGHTIDVLFPTQSEAYRWGRKKVKIKILN
ncbi:DUF348 domain-containing protein [Bacillus aquiflavi]|uniref:DUF348 domain-containing protein n=1 Tax=Bacillus aquiflavi TaxID=2672567 RepID=A0A6B3W1E4_9BACI|nr:G5 and 3D domain-containing protein [Bacillus aquiflavi]MBA4537456.1 DUF348 domain-containing protein [Bacillus aquiflavi]NEY81711.1 DUF348 domain-containing protein [Bacillus aquiflavi]